MKTLLIIALALLCSVAAQADTLPDKPQPQPRTADKEFWVCTSALATAWTLDTISTHQSFATHPHAYEVGGLFNGSRSVPKIMGAWAAVDIGAVVLSYEWKKHVRNRYLHPLWRVPLLIGAEGHTRAAINNW